jgi:hypothetical protein
VVMDMRRCCTWALAAAVMMGTGRGDVLAWGAEFPARARSSEKEAPGVMEALRLREEAEGVEGGEFELSLDMIGSGTAFSCPKRDAKV